MFKSTGILRYDPYRGTMKSSWWAVVDTDPELARYYATQVMANPNYYGETRIDLIAPAWGSHISVVRGEEPRDSLKHLWKKYDGEKIEFEYSHNIRRTGYTTPVDKDHFWFIEVYCPRLQDIRRELGLKTKDHLTGKQFTSHLTVGRTK